MKRNLLYSYKYGIRKELNSSLGIVLLTPLLRQNELMFDMYESKI